MSVWLLTSVKGDTNDDEIKEQNIRNITFVYPETKSQGLFHQIHKEVTFCGLPHGADA